LQQFGNGTGALSRRVQFAGIANERDGQQVNGMIGSGQLRHRESLSQHDLAQRCIQFKGEHKRRHAGYFQAVARQKEPARPLMSLALPNHKISRQARVYHSFALSG
jgi:hypothetical protein